MEKSKILNFISKYFLGGKVESAAWEVDNDNLKTLFVTPDKTMIGDISMKGFGSLEDKALIGVMTTADLIKMLSVAGDDFEMSFSKTDTSNGERYFAIKIEDERLKLGFMLADLSVIPKTKGLTQQTDMNLKIKLDKDFVNLYIKSTGALETKTFTILNVNGEYKLILGYSSEISTNNIAMNIIVTEISPLKNSISFDANHFKEILSANKDATEFYLEISEEGLAHAYASNEESVCNYYLLEANTDI